MSRLDAPNKESFLLFRIQYGDPAAPTNERFTDRTEDLTIGPLTYLSVPNIDCRPPASTGSLNEQPLIMELPLTTAEAPGVDLADIISTGEPHSRLIVSVGEFLNAPESADDIFQLGVYKGEVDHVVRNPQGRTNAVRLVVQNWKFSLDVSLGVVVTPECVWSLFSKAKLGKGCKATPESYTGTVTQIVGSKITLSGIPGKPSRHFHRGKMARAGLEILIREWISGDEFYLAYQPPVNWLNQTLTLTPGCNKTYTRCDQWGEAAKESFLGAGVAVPAYNPLIEDVL